MITLTRDSAHSYTDGSVRFPVVEGIPYLRAGREHLCAEALQRLERGDPHGALALLLCDQDDWARTAPPTEAEVRALLSERVTLREAMRVLRFGPVADYFAYRWSDPTFLSGLALLQRHLPVGARVLELGCGIGHYLREFARVGVAAIGADVVFAKLWVARRYLVPYTPLVCFDAARGFPLADGCVQAVFCHDAFYFLPEKSRVAAEMHRVAGEEGAFLVGHAHNALAENLSSGEPWTADEYAALFPGCLVYDDAELTRSWIENRVPCEGAKAGAAALAFGTGVGGLDFSTAVGDGLQLNPLFAAGALRPDWPSERYEQEYAGLSEYLTLDAPPTHATEELVRRRVYLDLPEEW